MKLSAALAKSSVVALFVLTGCGAGAGPATLQFVEIEPPNPRLGEIATVRFRVTDSRGEPLAGQTVTFRLEPDKAPGINLAPVAATSIKGTGVVETQIVATNRVNSVSIVASAGDKTVTTPALTFAGAKANGRQFTFQCGELAGAASGGIHALGAYDESRHLIAGVKLDCTAHVGDRNGDGVPDALVSFLTEAGTIGPTETSMSDVVGNATTLYKTSLPLPKEVDPDVFSWNPKGRGAPRPDPEYTDFTGEYLVPLWMHPFVWTENPVSAPATAATANLKEPRRNDPVRKNSMGVPVVNNPRDNLVTIIAVTAGEEGFTDLNGNGLYDMGEPFDDLTEPFVDANDNGTHDPEERFVDINDNMRWDGKNLKWDAKTLLWAQDRIIWTGFPTAADVTDPVSPTSRSKPTGTPLIPVGGVLNAAFDWSDPWFNSIAQNGLDDGCGVLLSEGSVTPSLVASPSSFAGGVALTYPPANHVNMTLIEVPQVSSLPDGGSSQVPRNPPASVTGHVLCKYTSSPIDGAKVSLEVGSFTVNVQ